ncbi:amine acid ABC transporter, permease protein, 3-TM region, His/Glu/Gln/Arg/opine family [Sphaerochaeta pleomorpha str. Grapes]|uniref:Amine acid ABC transporter, permease protein, 3-TM region, His/Glu/Gln/Arg/opine family n=1 Tax=Sphaerochaeta pleomorpha (strain ATCC BAA-1885 / DSM 22778 / Grapes) TaxID=158190 RepID=G8QYA3_SPHPG|nr:amino acid ABC transporter permease [Sphaerochaeta pleomorpha]AEV29668.1 amine acid ABC transporter, permease protein, 3-TM region, His/Glu/Gln/Arg/opine family [Sphaerochaeta pleomorpha str. Grapes]
MKTPVRFDPFKTEIELKHPLLFWIHQNLFSSPLNVLLTFFSGYLLYTMATKVVIPLFGWDWSVVRANLKFILTGSYPVSQLWRPWVCLCYSALLAGLTFRISTKPESKGPASLYIVAFAFVLLSFGNFSTMAKTFLAIIPFLLVLSFFFSKWISQQKVVFIAIISWIVLLPFCFILIRGFGGILTYVKTSFWGGLLLSLLISLTCIFLSVPIGLLLALGRRSKMRVVQSICIFIIEVTRGVPLITILFIGYLILPMALPASMTPSVFIRALTGIVMFHSAYMAESFRGGLQGISRTQYEAATSLNLSPSKSMLLVILPQVLKRMIPVLVNEFTAALKDTSLVSIIGMLDIIGVSTSIVSNPKYLTGSSQVLFFEGAIYFLLCYSISKTSRVIENKLGIKSKVGQ